MRYWGGIMIGNKSNICIFLAIIQPFDLYITSLSVRGAMLVCEDNYKLQLPYFDSASVELWPGLWGHSSWLRWLAWCWLHLPSLDRNSLDSTWWDMPQPHATAIGIFNQWTISSQSISSIQSVQINSFCSIWSITFIHFDQINQFSIIHGFNYFNSVIEQKCILQ